MTNSIRTTENNRKAFTTFFKLFGANFESLIFTLAGEYSDAYNGGHWSIAFIGTEQSFDNSFPIVPNDAGETISVCNPMNYFEGEMTNRAFGLAIFMMALSATSFKGNQAAHNAAEIYHLINEKMTASAHSTEEGSLTIEEYKMIKRFLD